MSTFDDAFRRLLGHEGLYWDDPVGGATKYGVTQKVARANGYAGDMKDLDLDTAKRIARSEYWDKYQCSQLPYSIAYQVFDTAYNGGYAIRWLQEIVGTKVDGMIGAKTIAAARAADQAQVVAAFNGKRLLYLTTLKNWQPNSRGWARRVAENLIEGVM